MKDDPRVDPNLRTFLSRTYQLKAIADYETGPGSHVSEESAREAIETARQLVEYVTGLLPPNGPAATPEPDPSR
jgi:HEPN domain-containing protein